MKDKKLPELYNEAKIGLSVASGISSFISIGVSYYARQMYMHNHSTLIDIWYAVGVLIYALLFNFISYAISSNLTFVCFMIGRKKEGWIRLAGLVIPMIYLIVTTIIMFKLYVPAIIGIIILINSNKNTKK